MIAITPEMIGPGIEEEYADAMERIVKLEAILKDFTTSNESAEGRMVYQLMWLRQEIEAQRLPIPLDRKYIGTLLYVVRDGNLDYLPGAEKLLGELAQILKGYGIVRPRHYPVVIAMLDDLLAMVARLPKLNAAKQLFQTEIQFIRDRLAAGRLDLPLDESRFPGCRGISLENDLNDIPGFEQASISMSVVVFSGHRPAVCRKGNLDPPNPGIVWGGDVSRESQ